MLKKVEIKGVTPNDNPKFVKTQLVTAERDGKEFPWEMIVSHDSVHVLVDNEETEELMFVKQVRVPVLVNNPETDGTILEACAGLVDKDIDISEIAREEILEEMGYDAGDVRHITTLNSAVGTSGTKSHCYYSRVDESMKVSEGGGLESEDIEVVRIAYNDVEHIMSDYQTDAVTVFLIYFWMARSGIEI